MDIVLLILLLVLVVFLIVILKNKNDNSSNELLIQLTNNLSSEIQNIRKEVGENSEKSRLELESKLSSINKEINNFHKTSKEDAILLHDLCETLESTSLCAMGGMTPNPIRSIIKFFPNELIEK